jgi:hypothetical protein
MNVVFLDDLDAEMQAMEDADERLRVIADLLDMARRTQSNAIIPDDDDPLELRDPTPELDLDFPLSQEDWEATWHIEFFQDYLFHNNVEDTTNE